MGYCWLFGCKLESNSELELYLGLGIRLVVGYLRLDDYEGVEAKRSFACTRRWQGWDWSGLLEGDQRERENAIWTLVSRVRYNSRLWFCLYFKPQGGDEEFELGCWVENTSSLADLTKSMYITTPDYLVFYAQTKKWFKLD